jgi:hypothetical protein
LIRPLSFERHDDDGLCSDPEENHGPGEGSDKMEAVKD